MTRVLYGAFFLSGLAGLVYESIWSRYLGLFVGHGAYAQAIVLVVFLGGLSLGSLLVAQRSERVRWPLLWYAGVEAAIGVYGLFFHDVYIGVTELARESLFPALVGSPTLSVVKWLLAGSLILPPAVLMGTTFPFMSAGVIRLAPERPGRTLSLLYFVNSLGAAAGAVVAGFFLLAYAGLPGTILTAAFLNLAVALAVWVAWRGIRGEAAAEAQPYAPREEGAAAPGEAALEERLWWLLIVVSFATALASFIYEIAWVRMLSLVLGSATHSFELMLSAFILGLALGSFWMRKRADTFEDPVRILGEIQWIMGFMALATLPVYVLSFYGMSDLLSTLQRNELGYRVFNVARYGFALVVMLPATFCAGTTLPLITRTLLGTRRGERAIGWVYGVNTLGSIVGVAAASLLLLPHLGLKNLLIVGAALDMLLGAALLGRLGLAPGRILRPGVVGAVGTLAVVALVTVGVPLDRALLNSGVYRYGRLRQAGAITYFRDGRTATVAVERGPQGTVTLSTNGKGDASVSDRWIEWGRRLLDRSGDEPLPPPPNGRRTPLNVDEPTQALLALITMAHRPEARTAAVVGQGSGITSHFVLGSPRLEEAVTVEIEPAMVEGSRHFYPGNRRVFDDPRSRIVIDDAKSYFASSQRRFDLMISEPSNPWVSGVASLFTVEFYETVRRHLRPGGVFGQWIQLYEIDDGLVLTILAALHRVFPSYQIFQIHSSDVLVVASTEPRFPEPDWSVFEYPAVRTDLAVTHPFTRPLLETTRVLDRRALAPLLERWEHANSDFFPLVDLGAERTRYLNRRADGFLAAGEAGFHPSDLFLEPLGRPTPHGGVPVPQMPRMRALARTSRLRAVLDSAGEDPGRPSAELGTELYRVHRLGEVLDSEGPPASWEAWTEEALEVARLLHAGLEGAVRADLFDRLERYLDARDAPRGPRAAVGLVRGLEAREWSRVAGAATVLAAELEAGAAWVPPGLLLDAGVAGLLATGEVEAARRHRERVEPRVARDPDDLRSRLLRAYLGAAEEGRLPPPA